MVGRRDGLEPFRRDRRTTREASPEASLRDPLERTSGLAHVVADGVDDAFLEAGSYELEVAGKRVPCAFRPGPLYDPRMERVKA